MKRLILAGLLLALAAAALMAQVTVAYVDGAVDVRTGSRWAEVFIGDSLDATDTIRLGNGAYCELNDGSRTVRLTRSGTYELADLFESAGRTERVGLAGLVLNRVGRLTGAQEEEQQTSAGGARAEAQEGPSMDWAGDETTDELVDQGLQLLNEGDYDGAVDVFEEAVDAAYTDPEIAKGSFYLGYAEYLIGNPIDALDLLEEMAPDPTTDFFASHILVLGQVLLESFAFEDAIDYLDMLLNADPAGLDPADLQYAQLMAGMAYRGLHMDLEARRYLRAAQRTVPGSDLSRAAAGILAEM